MPLGLLWTGSWGAFEDWPQPAVQANWPCGSPLSQLRLAGRPTYVVPASESPRLGQVRTWCARLLPPTTRRSEQACAQDSASGVRLLVRAGG